MSKRKYKKYKILYLPQVIVESVILYHKHRIEDYKSVQLDICFDILNNILQKSVYNRSKDESKDLFATMSSIYLKKRYKNKYKIHKDFLYEHNLIDIDEYFEGSASNFYIQDIDTYNRLLINLLRDFNLDNNNNNNIYLPYCVRNDIEITSLDLINNSDNRIQKDRIYKSWYKIKILIKINNKSFLTNDYVIDSKFINNSPTHIKKMGSHFRNNFALDTQKALSYCDSKFEVELKNTITQKEINRANNRFISRKSSILALDKGKANKSLRFNRNSTNKRLDTNLTNMASDLKPFIIGWDDLVYLDLKNSQPVLFNLKLNEYYDNASNQLKSEIDTFRKATFNGKWYEELMRVFKKDRDSCKEIWMCIAYSQNKSYQQYKKPFKEYYPEIYNIIENIKKTNYKDFAIGLQQIESKIFIDKICKSLVEVGIIPFTVHDALIVKKSEQEQTLQIMKDEFFNYLGEIPKISVE